MIFSTCCLYGINDIGTLKQLLGNSIFQYYSPNKVYRSKYDISYDEEHNRLIESPRKGTKLLQITIKKYLNELILPSYLYSKTNSDNLKNASAHRKSCEYIVKMDIKAFFPNTSRDKVYKFWLNDMNMSREIANIMTNLTTISTPESHKYADIFRVKRIKCLNHLPTGSPTSQILAFLVNYKMFEEIYSISRSYNGILSIYVDDITISGDKNIFSLFSEIKEILFKNGYHLSKKKSACIKNNSKGVNITGIHIDNKGYVSVPNKIREKKYKVLKDKNLRDEEILLKVRGSNNYIQKVKNLNKIRN